MNNLAYAVRLPLWGPGTAFENREAFISEIRAGGIAAMELVSRDLKAMGLYQARALSFAGVEYEILKHPLTPDQIAIYDAYADAWAVIHRNLEAALALTEVVDPIEGGTQNSGALAAARSRFESSKQRFFNQVLLSMKLPSLPPAMRFDLAAPEGPLDDEQGDDGEAGDDGAATDDLGAEDLTGPDDHDAIDGHDGEGGAANDDGDNAGVANDEIAEEEAAMMG